MPRLRIRKSILITTAIQAACLKALANITGQAAAAWQQGALDHGFASGPEFDWGRVAEFSFYGFVSASMGFPWQFLLENTFPTQPSRTHGGGGGSAGFLSFFRRGGGSSSAPGTRGRRGSDPQRSSQLHDGHDPDDPEKREPPSLSSSLPFSPATPSGPDLPPPVAMATGIAGGINWVNVGYKMVLDQTLWLLITTTIFLVCTNALRVPSLGVLCQIWREKAWFIIKAAWHVWPLVAILNFAFVPVDYRVLVASVVGFAWNVFLSLISLTNTKPGS